MSDLDDALVQLERAVLRLEAVPQLGDSDAAMRLQAERDADAAKLETTAAQIVARVEAALAKIGRALDGDC
jgi:hypothetical protein